MRGGEMGPRGDVPNPGGMSGESAQLPNGGSLGKTPDDPGIGKGPGKYGSEASKGTPRPLDQPLYDKETHQKIPRSVLSGAPISELNNYFEDIIHASRREDPNISIVDTYKKLADELPFTINQDALRRTLEATTSDDPDIKKQGEKAFLFLNTRQILALVEPHFTGDTAHNENVVQEALTTVYARMGEIDPERKVSEQLRLMLARGKFPITLAEEQNVPGEWVRDGKAGQIFTTIDRAVENHGFQPLSGPYLEALAARLSTTTGYDADEIQRVIKDRHAQAVRKEDVREEDDVSGDTTSSQVIKHARDEAINYVLTTIDDDHPPAPTRERVIRDRFGLNEVGPMTLDEIGWEHGKTPETIRRKEEKGLIMLRRYSRSDQLRDFRDLEEED